MGLAVTFVFNFEKALAAILYLTSKPDLVTAFDKYKAGKLVFLAEKYHLVRYGHPLLGDYYKAFKNGPAAQTVIDLLQNVIDAHREGRPAKGANAQRLMAALKVDMSWENPRFSAAEPPNMRVLSASEVEALDQIIALHGKKTFYELYVLTHGMAAYQKAWAKRGRKTTASIRIEDFFEDDSDAASGTFEEMMENAAIRRAFAAK